jgi:putative transposase
VGHTYACNHLHVVFSTKERANTLPDDLKPVWSYLVGIGANHKIPVDAIGGTRNHTHLLIRLPATEALAHAMDTFKSNTSKWLNEHSGARFAWQEGYGAFSVSASQISVVKRYIERQEQHHAKQSFEDEFLELLKKYGVEYDPRYVLG